MSSRVSTNQIYSGSLNHVMRAREKEIESAEKAQTHKEINRPSDDPGGWIRAQNLKDTVATGDKIERNAQIAMHFMTAAETSLTQMQEFVQRAYQLSVAAADSTTSRAAIFNDVSGLWSSILQAMNSRYGERSLFAGFKTQSPAFDRDGQYLGDDGRIGIHIEAGGEPMPINFSGEELFLGKGLKDGVDFPLLFNQLLRALDNDDRQGVRDCLPGLIQANEQMSLGRAEIAGRMTQVSRALETYGVEKIATQDAIGKLEDADAYKVFSALARDQAIFQSALATNKKVISDAPVDILFK